MRQFITEAHGRDDHESAVELFAGSLHRWTLVAVHWTPTVKLVERNLRASSLRLELFGSIVLSHCFASHARREGGFLRLHSLRGLCLHCHNRSKTWTLAFRARVGQGFWFSGSIEGPFFRYEIRTPEY